MQRRALLIGAAAAPALLSGCAAGELQTFPSIASALRAIEGLADGWRSSGAWSLAQVLEHAAQSVEYSLQGFPEMKSGVFRATVGRAAFALFDARGRMNHSLSEPIPGAPALAAQVALDAAIARAARSLRDFEAHAGALAPHFAYGRLDKAQFTRAHLMHLANHWTEVVRS